MRFHSSRNGSLNSIAMVAAKPTKDDKAHRVAGAILNLVTQQGISSLNPTRIARSANVSRPWIYKYIGGTREELMEFAAQHFGMIYSRLSSPFPDASVEEWIGDERDGLKASIDLVQEYPWILPAYYRYKGTSTAIGKVIEKIEKQYLQRKSVQIQKAVRGKGASSRIWAEVLLAFKFSLVHRWQFSDLRNLASEKDFLEKTTSAMRVLAELEVRR